MGKYVLIDGVEILGANAFHRICVGTPAMTALMGFVEKLKNELKEEYNNPDINIEAGFIINDYWLDAVKDSKYKSLHMNAKTVEYYRGDSNHSQKKILSCQSVSNQAYMDLNMSFLLKIENLQITNDVTCFIKNIVETLRVAGGKITEVDDVFEIEDLQDVEWGGRFITCEQHALNEAEGDNMLDKMIKACQDDYRLKVIPYGYRQETPFRLNVKNVREENVPHCFVESIYTLIKFKHISEIESIDELWWHYEYREGSNNDGIFICTQEKSVE